jgi:hypothetical protein
MKHLLRKLISPVRQRLRDRHERRLALLRAHVSMALGDEFRRLAAAQEQSLRQLAELNLFVEGLSREVLRLHRLLDERAKEGVGSWE